MKNTKKKTKTPSKRKTITKFEASLEKTPEWKGSNGDGLLVEFMEDDTRYLYFDGGITTVESLRSLHAFLGDLLKPA